MILYFQCFFCSLCLSNLLIWLYLTYVFTRLCQSSELARYSLVFVKLLFSRCKITCYSIAIRNGKVVWKHGLYCWCFLLNLKYLGWSWREYIKTVKNGGFREKLLSENNFKVVLATFCCCDHGVNTSEAVQKIATDQKDYHKCSPCALVWWISKIYQSITVKKGWLLEHLRHGIVAKKAAEVAQKKEQ